MNKRKLLLTSVLVCVSTLLIAQNTLFVNPNGLNTNDGLTKANALASIEEAISIAADGDTIVVSGTITENNILTNKSLTIKGDGAGVTIVQAQASAPSPNMSDGTPDTDAAPGKRIFTITGNAIVNIKDMTIRYGNMYQEGNQIAGGGIVVQAGCELYLDNCNILDCYTGGAGGGIGAFGRVSINNSCIAGNVAVNNGGGLYLSAPSETVHSDSICNSVFYDNHCFGGGNSNGGGGFAYADGSGTSNIYILNSTIAYNEAHDNGANANGAAKWDGLRVQETAHLKELKNSILFNSPLHNAGTSGLDIGNADPATVNSAAFSNSIVSLTWAALDANSVKNGDAGSNEVELNFGTFTQHPTGLWYLPILTGSSAIDFGSAASSINPDMFGNDRTSSPDAGAYELIQFSTINSATDTLNFGTVATGSSNALSISITNPDGLADLNVFDIDLPTGFSADWTSGTIAVGGSQTVNISFIPTESQSYNGTITVNSDASYGDSTSIIVAKGSTVTQLNKATKAFSSIYPNPTTGNIYINTDSEISSIQVLSLDGKIRKTASTSNRINIDNLPNGLYIVKIMTLKGASIHKIVKE